MIEEIDFETYLYVSRSEFKVFVFDKKEFKNLYMEELKVPNQSNFQDLSGLSKFLDEHIYKIEKLVGNFIKNITLIIENDKNLHVNIAIKKKNYENSLNQKYLENYLIEIKDLFKDNYQDKSIMHMVIVNYIINEQKYSLFKKNLITDNLCIEVNIISISNDLVFLLNKILEKFQIKVSQYMCGSYVKNFFDRDNSNLSLMAYKLKSGYNINEVILIPKDIENKGFFEKFFQLFS